MMVKCSRLSSISGPCLISMESARFDDGTNWPAAGDVTNQKPPKVNNTKSNFALFIWTPQQRFTCKLNFGTAVNPAFGKQHGLNSTLRLSGWSHSTAQSRRDEPVERVSNHQVYVLFDSSQCHYGIGIVGSGGTPHIAVAHGGSGGVGIRKSFPWVAAVPPVLHTPVNVFISGNGRVKPSVSVCRKATIWFSSVSVKLSMPTVMSSLFFTSAIGQQSTFSVVPAGQCPEVIVGKGKASLVL